jgi:uncharacterized protein DUF1501
MTPTCCNRRQVALSRREMVVNSSLGFGALALAHLLARDGHATTQIPANPLAPKPAQLPAKAKHVIFLFMQGGPSHLETFDPKPDLKRLDGQPLPDSFKNVDLAQINTSDGKLMASPIAFQRHGDSGLEISDLLPNIARHADDLAVIRSCYHDSFIHGPALTLMNSGTLLLGHPSVGSWVVYGLGCDSDSLPAYVAMTDGNFRNGSATYSSGFLPAVFQGTYLRTEGVPIQNLSRPPQLDEQGQRRLLDQISAWNRRHRDERPGDSRLDARIANYELAFRMQAAAPELIELSREPKSVRALYGLDEEPTSRFGHMCLLARRMVERGVRYVHLVSNDWDGHSECVGNHQVQAKKVDRPIGGLLTDLKQRGLLESTLIVWTGEFGRTPIMQGNRGRDHHPYGFSSWMAGGGVRGGKVIGASDELGFHAVHDKVHVNDLHATMLSLLGLDHTLLTFLFEGRFRRLSDVGGDNDLSERLTRA